MRSHQRCVLVQNSTPKYQNTWLCLLKKELCFVCLFSFSFEVEDPNISKGLDLFMTKRGEEREFVLNGHFGFSPSQDWTLLSGQM